MKYKYFLFDLDGTLCSTIGDLCASRNAALEALGYTPLGVEESLRDISLVETEFMRMALPEQVRYDETVYRRALELYREHQRMHFLDHTRPFDGIVDAVDRVIEAGGECAVLTNKNHNRARVIIQRFFPGRFKVVRGAVAGTVFKPDPRLTAQVMRELGAEGRNDLTVLIGDSDVDVLTAANAGVDCVAVTWGYRSRDLLAADGAHTLADTPGQLADILLKD